MTELAGLPLAVLLEPCPKLCFREKSENCQIHGARSRSVFAAHNLFAPVDIKEPTDKADAL